MNHIETFRNIKHFRKILKSSFLNFSLFTFYEEIINELQRFHAIFLMALDWWKKKKYWRTLNTFELFLLSHLRQRIKAFQFRWIFFIFNLAIKKKDSFKIDMIIVNPHSQSLQEKWKKWFCSDNCNSARIFQWIKGKYHNKNNYWYNNYIL